MVHHLAYIIHDRRNSKGKSLGLNDSNLYFTCLKSSYTSEFLTLVMMETFEGRRQSFFERRVVCPICLSPRLEMVTGICQHRFCTACVYTENGQRRAGLDKCPTCQQENALPHKRPIIPEDVIEMQRTLGITSCPNENCPEDMWVWEVENHLKECHTNPPKETFTLDGRCKKKLSTPKRESSPVESKSGKSRISTCEVGELLDGARTMMQQRRRSRSRRCLPDTFHMRYPLRNVNR